MDQWTSVRQWHRFLLWGSLLLLMKISASCSAVPAEALASTPTPFATSTPIPTVTPSPSVAPTLSPTSTVVPSPTATATAIPSPTATAAPTATPTVVPTATAAPDLSPDGTVRSLRVPILMYHYASEPPADADAVRLDLSVSPEQLDSQLAWIEDEGYEAISMQALIHAMNRGGALPDNPIILTFDDGHLDHYERALPILLEHDMTATFFVVTRFLDDSRPGYISWTQLKIMHRLGMEIGSHSYEHVDLAGQSDDYLVYQLLGSKQAIEERIGESVSAFCYPSGSYDADAMRVAESVGYDAAVTIAFGAEHHSGAMFELRRVRVHGHYDTHMLGLAIEEAMTAELAP